MDYIQLFLHLIIPIHFQNNKGDNHSLKKLVQTQES